MPRKGVVVVPSGAQADRAREGAPGTQRIANRPLICHVLDALRDAGTKELAVVASAAVIADVRANVEGDASRNGSAPQVTYIGHGGHGDPPDAAAAASSFVGDEPCVLHWADGLVGQPLAPFTDLFEANQPDFLLLVCASSDNGNGLDGNLQRILGIAELNGARSRLGVAGICMLGPNML